MYWRAAHALWTLLFALSAFVQLNDADPIVWFAIYAAAGLVSAFGAAERVRWEAAAAIALGAIAWAIVLVATTDDVGPPMAHGPGGVLAHEVVREVLGLGLVAFWMSVTAVQTRRSQPSDL